MHYNCDCKGTLFLWKSVTSLPLFHFSLEKHCVLIAICEGKVVILQLNRVENMMEFQLTSKFQPTGDQPQAIEQLTQGVQDGVPAQVLLGVTGSGKTFTMANVIQRVGKPTLIFSHNKTLAHQLYTEMKAFFPHNAVEYYVSYYDYYQPEAYIPSTGTYIEKDLAINEELDRSRLAAVSALLSGRQDVIIVSSVSSSRLRTRILYP